MIHSVGMESISAEEIREIVGRGLAEDIGSGDATTLAVVPEGAISQAVMRAREPLVVAGLALAESAFELLSDSIQINRAAEDGEQLGVQDPILEIEGPSRAILTAERVALNFVQRLSGIATLTAEFVQAIAGTKARILDTRKTTPGWRRLEKYAVRCGGGENHRFGLFDLILIKDNHLAVLRKDGADAIGAAVERARRLYPEHKVEVEADTLTQVKQALVARADMILLDNMSIAELREAVEVVSGRAKTEASGGITLSTVRPVAETGVDYISIGALTHSPRAADIALDFEEDRIR